MQPIHDLNYNQCPVFVTCFDIIREKFCFLSVLMFFSSSCCSDCVSVCPPVALHGVHICIWFLCMCILWVAQLTVWGLRSGVFKTTSDLSELLRQLNVYSMRLRPLTVDRTHSNATLLCNASVCFNALRDINAKRQSLHEGLRSGLVLKRTWIEFVSGSIVVFSFKSLICAHLRSI